MDLKQYISGDFITKTEIEDGEIKTVKVADEGEMVTNETKFGMQEQLVLKVETLDGTERKLGVRKGNIRSISKAYGTDTKEWIGKELYLSTMPIMVRGEKKTTIVIEGKTN